MTKRISCFVLALVMVLLAVPVFAIPAFAAQENYTTKWADNFPEVDNSVDLSLVKYPNSAWTVGVKTEPGNFDEFTEFTNAGGPANLIRRWGKGQWEDGGYYTIGYDPTYRQFITTGYTAVRYISERAGTAVISYDSIFFGDQDGTSNAPTGASNVAYAIFVNGTMAWPTEGGNFADETAYYNPGSKVRVDLADELGGLTLNLNSGDEVDFVFKKLSTAKGSWGAYKFNPVVTYTKEAETFSHTSEWLNYLPNVSPATSTVALQTPSPWTVGRINKGVILPYDRHQSGTEQIILNSDHTGDIWGWSGMWTGHKDFGYRTMVINANTTLAVGYAAEYTGTATITVRDILFRSADSAFAITVNDKYVFPANATSDKATWYKATTLNANVSSEIGTLTCDLQQGDEVRFLFAGKGWAFANFDPVVTYKNLAAGQNRLQQVIKTEFETDKKFTGASVSTSNLLTYSSFTANADLVAEYCGESPDDAALLAGYKVYFNKTARAVSAVKFGGNWAAGLLQTDGSFAPITNLLPFPDRKIAEATTWDTQWMVTEAAFNELLTLYLNGGQPNIWAANKGCYTSSGALEPTAASTVAAYGYTMPTSGYVTLSYKTLSTLPSVSYIGVLVNGAMVWPNANADINSNASYYEVAANTAPINEINASMAELNLYIEEGSVIQFVLRRGSSWFNQKAKHSPSLVIKEYAEKPEFVTVTYQNTNGADVARYTVEVGDPFPQYDVFGAWDINGDGVVDELPTTVTGDITARALLYGDKQMFANSVDNGAHAIIGGWNFARGDWSDADMTKDGLTWTKNAETAYRDGFYLFPDAGLWDAAGGGMYTDRKLATKAGTNGIAVTYTAPVAGVVNFSFDILKGIREVNSGDPRANIEAPIAFYISIVKNGEVIWPSEGSSFLFSTTQAYTGTKAECDYLANWNSLATVPEALPTNIAVVEGDEIAFVATMGNELSWMLYMDPAVTYTEVAPTVQAGSASVTLNENFAANFFVDANTLPEGATNIGAYVNGKFVAAVDGMITLPGIAAKNLGDAITVVPACTWKGAEMTGKAKVVSTADLLMQYINSDTVSAEIKAVAVATLNYAAAAQTYFGYNTDNLVNAGLAAPTVTGTYESKLSTTTDATVATFYGATLLLRDTLAFKFIVKDVCEGFETYTAQLSDGTNTVTARFVACDDGVCYKVIFDGIMPSNWDTVYTMTVLDSEGNPTNMSITYSVTTYLARMEGKAEITPIAEAMKALYEAAAAYNA